MAEEPGSANRRGIEPRSRKARLPFVKWVAIWTIVAAVAGGIFGATRLLAAIGGEPWARRVGDESG
jgi:hypothetical protein